jgi:zinc protease
MLRPAMRHRLTLLLLAFVAALVSGPAHADVFPYPHRTEVLPNGLKVILVPMKSPGLVSYYTVVRTGSRDEIEPGKSGFAHFFEHMMFRGTKRFPDYDRVLTPLGAVHNASTGADVTQYFVNCASADLDQVIDLESDRFQHLAYDEPGFQTEAGAVYGEYRKSITNPGALLGEKLSDLAFDTHTYKHTTIGFERDIKAMPQGYAYSLSFFQRFYRPDNSVILVVGSFDPDHTLAQIRARYGDWKPGYQAPAVPVEPPQTRERTGAVAYPGKSLPILDIGYKAEAFDPRSRRFAAALLLGQLAFGETSALYRRLYLEEHKVESLFGAQPMSRDPRLFEITAEVRKAEDMPLVQSAIDATIATYASTPVDAQRLADAKRRYRYALLMGLDSPARVAAAMVRYVALTGGLESMEQLMATIDQVSPEDLMEVARTVLTPERRTVVILTGAAS